MDPEYHLSGAGGADGAGRSGALGKAAAPRIARGSGFGDRGSRTESGNCFRVRAFYESRIPTPEPRSRREGHMPLEPQRLLITGANGFAGRHLLSHLLETGVAETNSGATAVVRMGERPVLEQTAVDEGLQITGVVQPEHLAEAQAWGEQTLPEPQR